MKKLSQSAMKKIIGAINRRSACGICYASSGSVSEPPIPTNCIWLADLLTGTVTCTCPATNVPCGDIEDP